MLALEKLVSFVCRQFKTIFCDSCDKNKEVPYNLIEYLFGLGQTNFKFIFQCVLYKRPSLSANQHLKETIKYTNY